jgi:hypothetical protein
MILNCFSYGGATIRTFAHHDARWFVLPDLCRALGIAAQKVAARLEDYERMAVELHTATGERELVLAVNVLGLHAVLSRYALRASTRSFRRWMVVDALPAMPPGAEAALPRSRDEIALLPPEPEEGLTSNEEVAHFLNHSPYTLDRLAGHLKTPEHGEFRPAVELYTKLPIQRWCWNEEGRHAVLKEFFWPRAWESYWSHIRTN